MKTLDPRLLDLLLVYEDQLDRGIEANPVHLCANEPELLPALLKAIAQLHQFGQHYGADSTLVEPQRVADSAPPPAGPLVPGFIIRGELGHGGMGIVHLAEQTALKRQVALKMILAGNLAGTSVLERFQREAEAVARLRHPGIVQIHEVGTWRSPDGAQGPYMALEYLTGGSLAQRLAGQPQPAATAVVMVKALAEAMQHAHAQGVLHRDLKPSNVLLTAEGEPKIADFGLARMLDTDAEQGTQTGAILGTPLYMSPEQATGQVNRLGPATDIWALGAILYEMLTGRPPFRGTATLETLRLVREADTVPPRAFNPGVPRDLETICLKCLQKEPGKRYATAQALADDLARFQAGEPILARPVSQLERSIKWIRRNPVVSALSAATLTVLVVGILVAGWYAAEAHHQAGEARKNETKAKDNAQAAKRAEAEATNQLLRAEAFVYASKLALAQKSLAVGNREQAALYLDECQWDLRGWEHRHLWAATHRELILPHIAPVSRVAWSPDGTRLITTSYDRTVSIWEANTGRKQFQWLLPDHAGTVGWSPERKWLFTCTGGAWSPVNRDTPIRVTVWETESGRSLSTLKGFTYSVRSAVSSPDGKWILTGGGDEHQGKPFPGELKLLNAKTGDAVRSFKGHTLPVTCVAFSPDGKCILSGGGGMDPSEGNLPTEVKLWNVDTGQEIHSFQGGKLPVNAVAFSPDNRRVVAAGGSRQGDLRYQGEVTVWDADKGGRPLSTVDLIRPVHCVAFSPNGKLLAAGNEEGKVVLWDTDTGREMLSFQRNRVVISDLAFSPDGTQLLVGGQDHVASVWNLQIQREGLLLKGHDRIMTCAVYSPRGTQIATGSADATVKIWNAETRTELRTLREHGETVHCLAWSRDGKYVASGSADGTAKIWQADTGQLLGTLHGHTSRVRGVAFSPDGRWILTGSEDQTARVWDRQEGTEILAFRGHSGAVNSVTFSPDGQQALTGSGDNTAIVWDVRNGQTIHTLKDHADAIVCVSWSRDGKRILTGSWDQTAMVWDAQNGTRQLTLKGHRDGVGALGFSPDGQRIVSGSWDGTARIWNAETGQELLALTEHSGAVASVAFSPDGRHVLLVEGEEDRIQQPGIARICETGNRAPGFTLRGHSTNIEGVAFSPDGQHFLTASSDGTAGIWDARKGQERITFRAHTNYVNSIDHHPDGKRFVTGGGVFDRRGGPQRLPGEVAVWDAATARRLVFFRVPSGPVNQVRWSLDGRRILTASGDLGNGTNTSAVQLWDAETGQELASLQGHSGPVTSVTFCPTGKRIAAAWNSRLSGPGGILLWDAGTGVEIRKFRWDEFHCVRSLAFSPDGKKLLTGGGIARQLGEKQLGEVIVWDLETGKQLRSLSGHLLPINSIACSPDGKLLLTGSDDGTARIWDAQTGKELSEFGWHRFGVTCAVFNPDGKWILTGSKGPVALSAEVSLWEAQKVLVNFPAPDWAGR